MSRRHNNNIHVVEESDENYVVTPLGGGLLLGACGERVTDGKGVKTVIDGYMIRLPVNDVTEPHLGDSNCTTRYAKISGTWIFDIGVMQKLNPKLLVGNQKE